MLVIETRLLHTFVEVVRTGSFAGAAKALSFTPSAVSQQIALLERATGATLFERSGRGVGLTEGGAALLVHARAVHARLEDAQAELGAIAELRGGRVRFGCFPSATHIFGAAAMLEFSELYPDVEVSFVDGEPYEIVARIQARELELALVFDVDEWSIGLDYDGIRVCDDGGVEYVELFDDPFLLVLPREHDLAACETVAISQLAGERFVGGLPWIPDFRRRCNLAGFEPQFDTSFRTTSLGSFQAFVAAGHGLTLIPELALTAVRQDIVVRPLQHAPSRHVKLGLPAGAYRSPATTAMIDCVERQVGKTWLSASTRARRASATQRGKRREASRPSSARAASRPGTPEIPPVGEVPAPLG